MITFALGFLLGAAAAVFGALVWSGTTAPPIGGIGCVRCSQERNQL